MAEEALLLNGIRKSFNIGSSAEVEILHGIDLRPDHGASCALISPSGSGKVTQINIIGLLDRQSAGRLAIGGQVADCLDNAALTQLRGRSIGFVCRALIPMLTDQNPCAQSRSPMDMMRHGWASSLFHASQQ